MVREMCAVQLKDREIHAERNVCSTAQGQRDSQGLGGSETDHPYLWIPLACEYWSLAHVMFCCHSSLLSWRCILLLCHYTN